MPVPIRDGKLGVGVSGIGWCAAQHIAAFQKNPHVTVTWLHGRDVERSRQTLAKAELSVPTARLTARFAIASSHMFSNNRLRYGSACTIGR